MQQIKSKKNNETHHEFLNLFNIDLEDGDNNDDVYDDNDDHDADG